MTTPPGAPPQLGLYIPHPESSLSSDLAPGSAIVGLPDRHGSVRIYFEGNTIGAANLASYRARAAQAAVRMLHNYPSGYPTVARRTVDEREVIAIGSIDSATGRVEVTVALDELRWWIDASDLEDLAGG